MGLSKLGMSCLWNWDRPKKQRLLMRWLIGKGAASNDEENRDISKEMELMLGLPEVNICSKLRENW